MGQFHLSLFFLEKLDFLINCSWGEMRRRRSRDYSHLLQVVIVARKAEPSQSHLVEPGECRSME